LAGDAVSIQGADAAEWSGERSAWALLMDQGLVLTDAEKARIQTLDQHIARRRTFGAGLTQAFPNPPNGPP
jgi:hypothetical protein